MHYRRLAPYFVWLMLTAPASAIEMVEANDGGTGAWSLRETDDSRLTIQQREAAVGAKVQHLLDRIYGPGRSAVRVRFEVADASSGGPQVKTQLDQVKRMHVAVEVQGLVADRIDDLTQIVVAASGADIAGRGDRVIVCGVKVQEAPPKVLKYLLEEPNGKKE